MYNNLIRHRNNSWIIEFTYLLIITMILSGLAYRLQASYLKNMKFDKWELYFDLIRLIRMFLIYVIPSIWFIYRYGGTWKDSGILPSSKYPLFSILGGILVYLVAIIVFLKYEIFFSGWYRTPWTIILLKFIIVGLMASITDYWTRGFILFELSKRYNNQIAIVTQNVVWFIIHIYEIDLLEPYIGLLNAIILTLILGIGGDLVALKTKSILGLMIGHILLNLAIILGAKDVIVIF